MFVAHKDYLGNGNSDESQTVLDIIFICNFCGKFEICGFNFEVTLRSLKYPQRLIFHKFCFVAWKWNV